MSTPNQINIDELSLTELKALAYDLGALYQHYQNQLQVINKKIEEKVLEAKQVNENLGDPLAVETPVKQIGKAAVVKKK